MIFLTLLLSLHEYLLQAFAVVKYFKKFIYSFIYFLVALGLCCCVQTFSNCSEQGLLIVGASLLAEHWL